VVEVEVEVEVVVEVVDVVVQSAAHAPPSSR